MKKYILSLMALVATMSINAQVVKVYKNGTLQETYTNTATDKYKVVFEEATAPADPNLLSGKFTVNADGKTVQFTKGNLYCNTTTSPVTYGFEANQTDGMNTTSAGATWDANHVGHFFWSKDAAVAYAQSYSDSGSTSDKFFCGEDNKITVEGTEGLYALSKEEWKYLIQTRADASNLYKKGVTVAGKSNCLIIAPDGFKGTIADSYTADTWATAEADGLVCLPAAGYNDNEKGFKFGGSNCYYWSSSPATSGSNNAYCLKYTSSEKKVYSAESFYRKYGMSVRLVK